MKSSGKKGNGLEKAEQDPCKFHGISPKSNSSKTMNPNYSEVFGLWLCARAKENDKLVAITPAMSEGSGMQQFAKDFPSRFFDVGIAEQHALTFAAGLATQGLKVVVAIYSTFLQRGFDQLIHDVLLQNLNVILAIDRAGLVGADGATHAGIYDLSFLRCVPNITIFTPSNADECYLALNTALTLKGCVAIRYPRGVSPTKLTINQDTITDINARIVVQGEKIAILSFGTRLEEAIKAAKTLNATVVDMRLVKPLDEKILINLTKTHQQFITIEDNVLKGGAGSAVLEFITQKNLNVTVKIIAIEDLVTQQGTQEELYQQYGLTAENIINSIK